MTHTRALPTHVYYEQTCSTHLLQVYVGECVCVSVCETDQSVLCYVGGQAADQGPVVWCGGPATANHSKDRLTWY